MKRIGLWAGLITMAVCAQAHHALEFIETESYTTPRKGEKVIYLRYDYMADDKNDPALDHWEVTPGLAFGLTDRIMFDAHTHYARFGVGHLVESEQERFAERDPSPFFEAVALSVQYRVTDGAWLDVAVAGRVEIPFGRARDWLDSEEVYEGVLIIAKSFASHANVTLNLIYGVEGSDDHQEFALGVKMPLSGNPHGIAGGIEFLGDFDELSDSWSVLPGVYIPISGPETVLKAGCETGKNADSTSISVSLMHLF